MTDTQRYNTGNELGSNKLEDLSDNAKNIDVFANSEELTGTNRLGVEFPTIAGIAVLAEETATAIAENAVASTDLTKPYVTATTPAMVELGANSVETFDARKTTSSDVYIAEDVKDGTFLLERTLFGNTKMEPFHPAEFPVDFTPDAPQLLIGSAYTTNPNYTERVYQGCVSATKTGSRMWAGFRGDIQLYTEGSDIDIAEHTGNFVTLCKSDDDGVTWSEYGYIRYADGAQYCCHEPVLWTAPDGKLWVFSTVSGNNTDNDGVYGVWVFVCKNPESDGAFLSWENPEKITPYGFMNYQPIDVNGKYIFGAYVLKETPAPISNYPIYSDTVGKNIFELDYKNKKAYRISKLPNSIDSASFDEVCLCQSHNGVTRAIWRTNSSSRSMETATSADGGKTWGSASKYTVIGDNPSSRAALKVSPSGRTVLAYNNASTGRQNLTLALSEDGGTTYPYKLIIEQPQPMTSSYPDLIFDDSGNIYVFYDKGRSSPGFRKILCTKIKEVDVINNILSTTTTYVSDKGYVA